MVHTPRSCAKKGLVGPHLLERRRRTIAFASR
jgi:hypothetical protein